MKKLMFSVTDFRFETKRGSGPGGQHRHMTESAVRCVHIGSGAEGNSQSERSQLVNKRRAFQSCVNSPKFAVWLRRKIHEAQAGITAEEVVDQLMAESNLKFEVRGPDGKWTEMDS